MLLCDIGNTFLHFARTDNERICEARNFLPENLIFSEFFASDPKIFYISVAPKNEQIFLNFCEHHKISAQNISHLIALNTTYSGLGVDRKTACISVKNGVVCDFGSAITIDFMREDFHVGGVILPGLRAFSAISPALKIPPDPKIPEISPDFLPQNTLDAMLYPLILTLKILIFRENLPVFFTGGDAKIFLKSFKNEKNPPQFFPHLIFSGMILALKKGIF